MGYTLTATRAAEAAREESLTGADAAMERYAQGDDTAFGEIYDDLAPRLARYFRRHTSSTSLVEDLVQQTLLHIHRARGSFIPGARVLPWAFAISRRLLIDTSRRSSRELLLSEAELLGKTQSLASAEWGGDQLLHARRLAERLARVLADLPEGQRAAYELLKHDGLSIAQAAEVLGVSPGAVKVRAHRAYEALRAVLRESGEIEAGGEA